MAILEIRYWTTHGFCTPLFRRRQSSLRCQILELLLFQTGQARFLLACRSWKRSGSHCGLRQCAERLVVGMDVATLLVVVAAPIGQGDSTGLLPSLNCARSLNFVRREFLRRTSYP